MTLALANLSAAVEYHRGVVRSADAHDEWVLPDGALAAIVQAARAADAFVRGGITEYQLALVVEHLQDELSKAAP